MRKTKIICTLGPAVDDEETLRKLILKGMNAARFNFSHGTHESHLAQLTKLKRVRDGLGAPVATILDTKGPEIRVKTFENSPVTLERGQTFVLHTDDVPGDHTQVSVTYQNLHNEVGPGCRILVDDGLIELKVERIEGASVVCEVENGGPLSSNKSINIPDVHIHLPSLTDKDRDDIKFAVENDFDFIAASFVRKASDVEDIRAELHKHEGGDKVQIIAKIENRTRPMTAGEMAAPSEAADKVVLEGLQELPQSAASWGQNEVESFIDFDVQAALSSLTFAPRSEGPTGVSSDGITDQETRNSLVDDIFNVTDVDTNGEKDNDSSSCPQGPAITVADDIDGLSKQLADAIHEPLESISTSNGEESTASDQLRDLQTTLQSIDTLIADSGQPQLSLEKFYARSAVRDKRRIH